MGNTVSRLFEALFRGPLKTTLRSVSSVVASIHRFKAGQSVAALAPGPATKISGPTEKAIAIKHEELCPRYGAMRVRR